MSDPYKPGGGFKGVSSPYGWRIHPKTQRAEFHAGQDFGAPEGTPIRSAASGVVVYSGKNAGGYGNLAIVKNDTGSSSVYAHMRGDDQVKPGQRVWQGDTIGRVGNTGDSKGPHLHYSVITEEASKSYDPKHPLSDGPMGLHLDDTNTYDPATYKNYVLPPPPHLGQSQRGAELVSGDNADAASRISSPDTPARSFFSPFGKVSGSSDRNPVAERFGRWGSVPLPNTPVASDAPTNFADRFGNWELRAPGAFGHVDASAPRIAPDPGKRSEADDDAPSLSPASASPLLGIFSGKPMPDYPVWPSIFATDDRSSPDDDELYQRWRRFLDA